MTLAYIPTALDLNLAAPDKGIYWKTIDNTLLVEGSIEVNNITNTISGNSFTLASGIQIGNNTATAATAGEGSLRWTGSALEFSDGVAWNTIGGIAGGSLSSLSDVSLGTPTLGQVLTFNGLTWENADATGGSSVSVLNDLTDVTLTAPSSGQVLTFNGSQWVNVAAPSTNPGGATTQLQFNNAGSFAGSSSLTFIKADNKVIISGTTGTSGNNLEVANGIRIGNNAATATSAGAGSLRYNAGTVEVSNGSTWTAISSGLVIGGVNTQVQFNDSGVLGGSAGFTWDKTNHYLLVSGTTGTSGNNIESGKGLKIGTNTATAANAGAGSLRYNTGLLELSDGTNWKVQGRTTSTEYFTATDSQTVVTLAQTPSEVVYFSINGLIQTPINDYNVVGTTLTYTAGLSYTIHAGDLLVVCYQY